MTHYLTTQNTTTTDTTGSNWLLRVSARDGDQWLVVEDATDVYGHGPSLLHALCDFYAALGSHLAALDGERLTPRLQRQMAQVRELLSAGPADSEGERG